MGRGDRAKVRWKNKRIRKKKDRDRRIAKTAGERKAEAAQASS